MPAGISLRCPYHAFLFGVACAGTSVAVALLISRRQRCTIRRFGVEGRFTDVASFADLVFMSGQVALGDSIEEQTARVLQDIDNALEKAGSDKTRILELTIWLADMSDYDAMNAVYDSWIDPGMPHSDNFLLQYMFRASSLQGLHTGSFGVPSIQNRNPMHRC